MMTMRTINIIFFFISILARVLYVKHKKSLIEKKARRCALNNYFAVVGKNVSEIETIIIYKVTQLT